MRSKQPCFSERPLSSTWSYVLTERVDLVSTNFANSLGFAEPIKTDVSLNPGLDTNVKFLGDVFVRDPPRSYLPIPTYPSLDHSRTDFEGGRALCADTRILKSHPLSEPPINPTTNDEIAMPGKRRSLQSILVPSFLHLPPTQALQDMEQPITSRTRSHSSAEQSLYYHESTPSSSELASTFTSPRSSPPPDFLLDDDPFANLSGSTLRTAPDTVTVATPLALPVSPPRSPLTSSSPSFPGDTSLQRPVSSGRGQVRPAYQKRAFAPRPSLPSLHTLASMNIVVPRKVRKGRVGAKLPYEPWDLDSPSPSTSGQGSPHSTLSPSPSSADFVSDLEHDFSDLSEDLDDYTESSPTLSPTPMPGPKLAVSSFNLSCPSLSGEPFPHASRPISAVSTSGSSAIGISTHQPHTPTSPPGACHTTLSSSAESEGDTLSSPPDDSFFFSTNNHRLELDWRAQPLGSRDFDDPFQSTRLSNPHLLNEPEVMCQAGTSSGTIREVVRPFSNRAFSASLTDEDDLMDASGWGRSNHVSKSSFGGIGHGDSAGGGREGGGARRPGGRRGGGGAGDGDDRRDDKHRPIRSTFVTPSSSEPSSDEEDESTDDYGRPSAGIPHDVQSQSGSDDDIPLAQRIPTALTAQRTIRRQVREERDQRRKERLSGADGPDSRGRQTTLRPAGAGLSNAQEIALSSSREAALHASKSTKRQRTQTLPGRGARPFEPEDLAKKLQNVQVAEGLTRHHTTTSRAPNDQTPHGGQGFNDPTAMLRSMPNSPGVDTTHTLRPMRSFHRVDDVKSSSGDYRSVPMPVEQERVLGRSLTRARSRPREDANGRKIRTVAPPIPLEDPAPRMHRTSEDHGKFPKSPLEPRSARSSGEHERVPRTSIQRPPVPQIPVEHLAGAAHVVKSEVIQQRVFIGDMQRFNMVEIGSGTTAGDVLAMVEAQGTLKGWVGSGGWMLWEVAQDFGMERPIRSFELLSDVQVSWNKDKMINTFILKLTPLAPLLSRSAIPSSSPTMSGYVEWESKRGKWNKRWLRLREHSLWLSKRDNGKDEVFLCSLSNFDAYSVTRLYKAPKAFVFAVKSTDNISFFENTADYLHVFSCVPRDGAVWFEKILLARSYVLHQERNILFNPKVNHTSAPAGALSRSGTRKTPSSHRGPQALVAVPNNDVFEPGSLLHKHT